MSALDMSEVKSAKLGKVARLRKRLSDSLGRLACESLALLSAPSKSNARPSRAALAKEDWSVTRTRSTTRLSHLAKKENGSLSQRGKAGFSDEYLDKLDSDPPIEENDEKEADLRWERLQRLRLSDGDLLSATRDPEFEKLKVIHPALNHRDQISQQHHSQGSAGADSGLGSDETGPTSNRITTVNGEQVVLRRSKKSVKQRPKSEMVRHHQAGFDQLDTSASVCNLKPSEARRSKRYSAFGVRISFIPSKELSNDVVFIG